MKRVARITPSPSTDARNREQALIARVRRGDAAALHDIYVAHYHDLWRFATKFVHAADAAEDVVHAIFTRIWRHHATWRVDGVLDAYLRGAVRHEAFAMLKHEAVVARTEARARDDDGHRPPGMGQHSEPADRALDGAELSEALDRAIAQLPERRRVAATLRWVDGLSYADIGRVMRITADAAYMHVARARTILRAALARFRE